MNDITIETSEDGTVVYYLGDRRDNIFHCEDGPAIKALNGDEEWYYEGTKHRDGGPAVKDRWGEYWFSNGLVHREDGPAVIRTNGDLQYWHYGQLHCEDGPAIVRTDGDRKWFLFGKRVTQTKFHEYRNAKLNTEK